MNEYQKQAGASALIKLENSFPDSRHGGAVQAAKDALEIMKGEAHESVQNGTCDESAI